MSAGIAKGWYPFPRINLIDRPNHHEAIVHTWSVNGESAHEIACDLVARIVDGFPVVEFLVILLGENHLAFSSSYSGSDEDFVDSPDDLKAREQMVRMLATGPVLMCLPKPTCCCDHEAPAKDCVDDTITIEEVEAAILRVSNKANKTPLEWLKWIASFSFDNLEPLRCVPIHRETRRIPPHVLYFPDLPYKALIWDAKRKFTQMLSK